MKRMKFMIFIGTALIIMIMFFACEQTVKESVDDSSTGASSSSSSSDSSSSSSESSSSSDSSSSESSSSVSSSPYALYDNFNSYSSASPWTPAGGWAKQGTPEWYIVAGYDGNGLQSDPNIIEGYICLPYTYTGSNCTVSAKSRATVITAGFGYGLSLQTVSKNYLLEIAYFSGTPGYTRIAIYKNGSMVAGNTFLTGQLNTDTYYTLSLSVTGATDPVLTATITDGATPYSCTFTDTGTTLDSFAYAGIYSGGAKSIIYDDFMVTEP